VTHEGAQADSGPLIKLLSRDGETKETRILDDLDWDEAMRIRFASSHFASAPSGSVDYNYTTDKAGLAIGLIPGNTEGGAA
jgi:type III restriction enzyme